MPIDKDVQERLKLLRESYSKQLPAKLEDINQSWQSLRNQWDWDEAGTFHRLIHSIAGSGGSFGFGTLSKKAREIEIQMKACIKQQQVPEEEQLAEIDRKLAELPLTADPQKTDQ
jgi:HPt (histidine-containing phosphotransfer) domain-containing protein